MLCILVLNLGSTSFKFKLYNMGKEEILIATGRVESIGDYGVYSIKASGMTENGKCTCLTHGDAMEFCLDAIARMKAPIVIESIDAIGYKAVHGGGISGSHFVDDTILSEIEHMVAFAPAHNPVYLTMMRNMRKKHPKLIQIACFETAFHTTIPFERAVYGVPFDWVKLYDLRRYGFHGSSHSYIAWKMEQESPKAKRIISAHLGGSCSICAIKDGRSIANSMGATPQSGVFHNNRVGDFDVFCLPFLVEKLGGMDYVIKALSDESGLLGLSGVSNDMRTVEQAAAEGNERAKLAIAAFVDSIVGYIGMYTAYLGGVDAIIFTGGIGMNAVELRFDVVSKLGFLHALLEKSCNISGFEGRISAPESGVEVWSFETNEELMVARSCVQLLKEKKSL